MVKYIFGHKNPDTDSVCSAIVYGEYLEKKGEKIEVCSLGEINNETKFLLENFGFRTPKIIERLNKNSQIILVDHNEIGQTIDNIENYEIVEIVDHHKISLKTDNPLKLRFDIVGSTCTIIAKIFFENNISIEKSYASLLIGGIISDTLYFRSPTSTIEDKEIMMKLNEIAEIEDLEKFSLDMFSAKSNLGDIDVEKLIKLDYKEFEFNSNKYGIGVQETTNPDYAIKRKSEIVSKLKEIKKDNNLKGIFFSIIDILNEESFTICSNAKEEELFKNIFKAKEKRGCLWVDKLISRKKQTVPKLEEYFSNK